ncbi:sigma factor-like helix-turn-helix DNA-binding protein [Streptomyces hokutonensis]|uniref:sigma factor-like helix-turn-helix DNA-binding protein n=1 Tax=Streptomyces hokutonensis TaxID=1306990 RepID=UPI0034028818
MGPQHSAAPPSPVAESRTDEEPARRLVAGDEGCLAVMHHRWSPLVDTLARRSLRDAKEAEDVTQQVFLGVWRGRPGFRPGLGTIGVLVLREPARLPAPQQRVLRLTYYEDLTRTRIARRTGLPLGTVKSHARRGLHQLRRSLGHDEQTDHYT